MHQLRDSGSPFPGKSGWKVGDAILWAPSTLFKVRGRKDLLPAVLLQERRDDLRRRLGPRR